MLTHFRKHIVRGINWWSDVFGEMWYWFGDDAVWGLVKIASSPNQHLTKYITSPIYSSYYMLSKMCQHILSSSIFIDLRIQSPTQPICSQYLVVVINCLLYFWLRSGNKHPIIIIIIIISCDLMRYSSDPSM